MKTIFLSFGNSDLQKSAIRIKKEAINMQVYDEILTYNEKDLDPSFREYFKKHLRRHSRGFGYWCWKPQIILQTLLQMQEGDLLHYADMGCHLNPGGIPRLKYYINRAASSPSGILAFQGIPPDFHDGRTLQDLRDKCWTKGDLIDHFNVRNRADILETPTYGSGTIFIKKSQHTTTLIEKWMNLYYKDIALMDDSPSRSANIEGFIENRHDQAGLSILCKLYGVETLSAYEYWYPKKENPNSPDWALLSEFPIHACRNKQFGFRYTIESYFLKIRRRLLKYLYFLK